MIDYAKARESLYVLKVDASQGAGDRLNQALAARNLSSIRNDAEVKSLVALMKERAKGGAYEAVINDLAAELGAPATQIPTPPPPQPAPSQQTPQAPAGDFATAVRAVMEQMGVRFASNGMIGEITMVSIGAPEGPYWFWIGASDAGGRTAHGWASLPNGQVIENKNLPRLFEGTERDGVTYSDFSLAGTEGDLWRPFKTVARYFGGFRRGVGPRNSIGRYVDYAIQEKGRDWRYSTAREGPDIDIQPVWGSDSRDPANPFVVRVGNQVRRLVIGADGKPAFGEVVDEDA